MKTALKLALSLGIAASFVLITAESEAGRRKSHPYYAQYSKAVDTYLTEDLDITAQDPGAVGTMYAGTGIPATNFVIRRFDRAGIELAIKAHYRQGYDIPPTYVDGKGIVHIVVPAGHQIADPANGVPSTHTGRARWNFAYSYDAALNGGNPDLEDYRGWLLIDTDPSEKTRYLWLQLKKLTNSPTGQRNGYGWVTKSTVEIGDDEGTSQVSQNSQNLAFYEEYIDADPRTRGQQSYMATDFGPGQFDVMMILEPKRKRHRDGAVLRVVFDVVEP